MIGTSAMSSNSKVPSAARPTGVRVSAIRKTSAVDERARARPSARAVGSELPSISSTSAISAPPPNSSIGPIRKIVLRICQSRLNDSSSPMVNSSRMIPNSANGASRPGSLIVM
jgi:hypothetical protein